jgi:Domain of unknown function (DUF6377)
MRLSLILVLFFVAKSVACAQTDSVLQELQQAIDKKSFYDEAKLRRLNVYHEELAKSTASNLNEQFLVLNKLTQEYKPFIYDSAFAYSQRLLQVAYAQQNKVRIAYAKNQLGFILLSSGMFKETLDSLKGVSMKGMPDSIKADYYAIMSRTYYDLVDFDQDRFYRLPYLKLGTAYIDSAQRLYPPGSYNHIYSRANKNLKNENTQEALADLTELLERPDLTLHQIAITASTLSYYYSLRDQSEKSIALLARAATADIKGSIKETVAIYNLADLLYKKGDIKNAYAFIQQAMDDAVFYGARQRKVQVGSVLPLIASAQLNNVEEQRRLWLIYSSLITGLAVLVVVFAVIIFKQLKKRKLAERALQEANKIKEEYIGYYFNVNSEYVSKIETFKKSIEMKLMTKKMEDIKLTVSNINTKKEREELYTSFDQIFLKLFPDFVKVFNSYFPEEDRIVLKEGQLMNTELRIFALIRMGIHDPEKIAKILDYSINTIYNYKARVKGKSFIPNEEFEKKIMEIHAL